MSPLYTVLFWLNVAVLLPSSEGQPNPACKNLYEEDPDQWLENQIFFLNRSDFSRIDVPNLVHELQMMAAGRSTIAAMIYEILLHLLKMVCDPLYPSLNSWMRQIWNFRRKIQAVADLKGNKDIRKELTTYQSNVKKNSKDRELTPLEGIVQQMWARVTATENGILAIPVVEDSDNTIRFYDVPEVCPLTLEQVLQAQCFPRKAHYGPHLVCEGRALNGKQEKRIKKAQKQNETLDDYWFHNVPAASLCPEGFN